MTAHGFIEQLFARPSRNLPGHMRPLTGPQLALLRELIGQDEEGSATARGESGALVWMPSGRWKYVLSEDPLGRRHTITRLGNLRASAAGSLF